MRDSGKALLLMLAAALATEAGALPIGFGVNQRDREYDELKSPNFYVYHDRRVPTEGKMTMNALEGARPLMERWFKVKRSSPLVVVSSAATENASFANFITDAIELQTAGQGSKELAWHEYTHQMTYRQLDNFLGPAGNIVHLPWMPAWFLEGLAELTSVSVGSDTQAGIERYQALMNDWPTYDRLHSLYAKYGFFERGYSTAGAIVNYAMKLGDANKLPQMLDGFYWYTMPWWWPYGLVPVVGKLPMDMALKDYANVDAETLYERYKKDATAFWKSSSTDPLLVKVKARTPRRSFSTIYGMRSDGKRIRHVTRYDDELFETELVFDPKTGWATETKKIIAALEEYDSFARILRPGLRAGVKYEKEMDEDWSELRAVAKGKDSGGTITQRRQGTIFNMWETKDRIVWMEQVFAKTRLCATGKPGSAGVAASCPIEVDVPKKLRSLGVRTTAPGATTAKEIWLSEAEEKLKGTVYTVKVVDGDTLEVKRTLPPMDVRPMSVAFAGDETWILVAERNTRTLRRYGDDGRCQAMYAFKDHLLDVQGLADGSLAIALYGGDESFLLKLDRKKYKERPCRPELSPTSPLQYALQMDGDVDLKTALAGADLWTRVDGTFGRPTPTRKTAEEPQAASIGRDFALEELVREPPLDQDLPDGVKVDAASKPARWRPRPLFLFPWIGADDALGTQVGVVTVPLMDHLQNETVRVTALYGMASRFPATEIGLTSTRFRPILNLSLYRQQTYNGRFYVDFATRETSSWYLDERGVRLESDTDFKALGGSLNLGAGVKYAELKPYISPRGGRVGKLVEPAGSIGLFHALGDFGWSNRISGRVAPAAANENFDYNQLGLSTSLSRGLPFLASRLTLGLEGSRTRGKKMRELREMYTPLKTFIPGSGGGYNQNNFPITDPDPEKGLSLFSPIYGNNQARAKANFTFPIFSDIDKILWILYAERLDFTAFYNYGAAWAGKEPRVGWDKLVRAHGYNLDFQLENKGVRFNLGAGIGQVVGNVFETYLTSGFDALF